MDPKMMTNKKERPIFRPSQKGSPLEKRKDSKMEKTKMATPPMS
jgi:hypothetical protein